MRAEKRKRLAVPLAGALCAMAVACTAHAAMTFNGNGASGFGGTLGNGSLSLSDSGGNLTATFNPSGGFSGNDVVVYIDSTPGGFSDTSTFSDNGDGGRESVSAENSGNPSRDLITFPTGFGADFALEFENNTYIGLFGLVSGGNNSLNYITGTAPASGGPYTVTFPLADIGVAQGQSFNLVADLISTTAYGSNETIGSSAVIPDTGSAPNAGFNGSVIFSSSDTYTTAAVPEPASLLVVVAGGFYFMGRRSKSA